MDKVDKLDQLIEYIRDNKNDVSILLRASFKEYLKTMFFIINESNIILEPFHDELISRLQKIVDGENEKRNLAINIPVGSGKSLIIEFFLSWCFARTPDNAFLYLSYSDKLITKLSRETKDIVCNDIWVFLFGSVLKKDDQSKINWSFKGAKNRTGLFAGSTGGGVTGLDAGNPNIEGFSGALIVDDPLDVGKVKHKRAREECCEYYDSKLETRRRTPTTPTILIMQRLHKEDLTGHVVMTNPEEWDVLKIPALVNGKSFWESRYPVKELERISRTNSFLFAGQYQQDPISTGGNVIKTEWYKYYQDYAKLDLKRLFITSDTAQKTKEANDYSVFCLWGVDGQNLYLLDVFRGKWTSPELRKNAKQFWDKWINGIREISPNAFYVEDKSSGTGLIQDLQSDSNIPIIAVPRVKDKGERLSDVLPYIEAGRVYLPVSENYSFVPNFLSESEEMTLDDTHSFDDQIDTLIDAINIGLQAGNTSILDVI